MSADPADPSDPPEHLLPQIAGFADAVIRDTATRAKVAARLARTSGIEQRSVERLLALWPTGFDAAAWALRLAALRRDRGLPSGTVALIAAGNMPVATWTAAIELLALGLAVRIRPASGDPDAPAALVDWLAALAPTLAQRVTIAPCRRDDLDGWRRLLHGCSAVVVFGSDAATDAVAGLARSLGCQGPVRRHGEKLSLGWLDPDGFARAIPTQRDAWLDDVLEAALLADGRGCLSLRALLVPGPPAQARVIAQALALRADAMATRFPAGALAMDLVAARALALEDDRLEAAMAGGVIAEQGPDAATPWAITAVGTARRSLGARDLGPGGRLLRVIAVDPRVPLDLLVAPLAGHLAALATVAVEGETLGLAAAEAGFWRVCAPAALQAPPWHRHDGVEAGAGLLAGASDPFSA